MPEETKPLGPVRTRTVLLTAIPVLAVLVLIPVPALLLDILTGLNLGFALALLFGAFCIKKTARFSSYPTLLLVSVFLNAAISVSAARLILGRGADFDGFLVRFAATWFTGGAGEIAQLTGGTVIFFLILAVQTMLIIKGVYRATAGEADGLTLEDMPVKQAAIDSELSDGLIGQEEYAARKKALQEEAAFYKAMNGAAKVIAGNEIFRLCVIAVTVLGGAFISGFFYDIQGAQFTGTAEFMEAAKTYIPLVIGNGVLSMLPAFLVAAAVTVVITRAVFSRDTGKGGR